MIFYFYKNLFSGHTKRLETIFVLTIEDITAGDEDITAGDEDITVEGENITVEVRTLQQG